MAEFAAASPLKGPSLRSFFTDSVRPESFLSIDRWNEVRDFLFYFGAKYKDKASVDSGVYRDRRRYAYSIGKYMNIIQQSYSEYISTTTLNGRLIVENFCGIFAPAEGYQSQSAPKTTGEKLAIVEAMSAELKNMVDTHCKAINKSGNGDAHEHVDQIPVDEKGKVVDHIFQLCSYVMRYYILTWPADAERAKQWMAKPQVFLDRLKPSFDDQVTEIQLWLADNGLDECRSNFVNLGVKDVETLLFIKEEGADTVKELLDRLQLSFGLNIKFKRKLADVSADTVAEYQQALVDFKMSSQRKAEEDAVRRMEEDAMRRSQEAVDASKRAEEDALNKAQKIIYIIITIITIQQFISFLLFS